MPLLRRLTPRISHAPNLSAGVWFAPSRRPSLGSGGDTFRKMETSTGTGALSSGALYPDLSAKPEADLFAADAVKPEDAIKRMQKLVDSGEASAEAMGLLQGVIAHFKAK